MAARISIDELVAADGSGPVSFPDGIIVQGVPGGGLSLLSQSGKTLIIGAQGDEPGIRIPSTDANGLRWSISTSHTDFQVGERDNLLNIGWNMNAATGRENASYPHTGLQIESHYVETPGGHGTTEIHWNTGLNDGTTFRPWMVNVDKVTGTAIHSWRGNHYYYPPFGSTPILSFLPDSGMQLAHGKNLTQLNNAGSTAITLAYVRDDDLIGLGAGLEMNTSPILLDSNLDNSQSRPAISAGRIAGEINGHSRSTPTNGDGFLRLSAGGIAGSKTYIDLAGNSGVSDMDKNVVFGIAGAEKARINSSGFTIASGLTLSSGSFTYPGTEAVVGGSITMQPTAGNTQMQITMVPLGSSTTTSIAMFGGATIGSSPYLQLTHIGTEVRLISAANGAGTPRNIVIYTGSPSKTYTFNTNGNLSIDTGVLQIASTQVVGARGAAVADATDAASVITQLNLLLARLRAATGHGLIA